MSPDTRYFNRHLPTMTLYLWPGGLEYWWSAFDPIGLPLRRFFEPIEDEM
jgi:hypothetical protein